jgi:hypothetical protein
MIIDFDEKKVSMWLYFSSRRQDALMEGLSEFLCEAGYPS